MAGHVRKGRIYKSPLAASGVLGIENWIKDDLPDLLWPVLVLSELGNDGVRLFVEWQKAVQERVAGHDEDGWIAETLDGRLTNLAALAARFPDAPVIVVEEADRRGLLSEGVRGALASYPHLPARWLVGDVEVTPPQRHDLELITDALIGVIKNSHREALLKCLRTWSTVQAGTFRSSAETIDLLKDYPSEPTKRAAADSTVRAMWGAHRAMIQVDDPNHFDEAIKWARVFWGANSMTSRCIRKREIERPRGVGIGESEPDVASGDPDSAEPTPMPEGGATICGGSRWMC